MDLFLFHYDTTQGSDKVSLKWAEKSSSSWWAVLIDETQMDIEGVTGPAKQWFILAFLSNEKKTVQKIQQILTSYK